MQVVTCFQNLGLCLSSDLARIPPPIYPQIYRSTGHDGFSVPRHWTVDLLARRGTRAMLSSGRWTVNRERPPTVPGSPATVHRRPTTDVIALLTLVFVVSGAAGLIYES